MHALAELPLPSVERHCSELCCHVPHREVYIKRRRINDGVHAGALTGTTALRHERMPWGTSEPLLATYTAGAVGALAILIDQFVERGPRARVAHVTAPPAALPHWRNVAARTRPPDTHRHSERQDETAKGDASGPGHRWAMVGRLTLCRGAHGALTVRTPPGFRKWHRERPLFGRSGYSERLSSGATARTGGANVSERWGAVVNSAGSGWSGVAWGPDELGRPAVVESGC